MLCQDSLEKLLGTLPFAHLFLACPKGDIAGDVLRGHAGDEAFLPVTSIDFVFNHVKTRIRIIPEASQLKVSCCFILRIFAAAVDSDFFCFYVVSGQIINMQQHIDDSRLICFFHRDPPISLDACTDRPRSKACSCDLAHKAADNGVDGDLSAAAVVGEVVREAEGFLAEGGGKLLLLFDLLLVKDTSQFIQGVLRIAAEGGENLAKLQCTWMVLSVRKHLSGCVYRGK